MPEISKRVLQKISPVFKKNTGQINKDISHILSYCAIIDVIMVILSGMGFFEFNKVYTYILLLGGLFVCLSPRIFLHFFTDSFMKYYMLVSAAIFIGIIGADKNIGIYITYALVPILSCLYFETSLLLEVSAFSYIVMIISVYVESANMYEVIYQGREHVKIFLAYAAGFTLEYIVVTSVLFYLVKRAKRILIDYSNSEVEKADAEKERQIYNALCVNYTAAYRCDLIADSIVSIKNKEYSHGAQNLHKLQNPKCYSEWIQYGYNNFIVKESAPDYVEFFDRHNLMQKLKDNESLTYRHRTSPNGAGMEYFEATVVKLYENDKSFVVIIGYRPIDEIIAEEKKRQELEQQRLQEAYRIAEHANEAKTTFLLNMSHDIRTPMNAILGYTKLMNEKITDTELMHYQKMIEQSGNLLLSIINNILDMARIESGKMELDEDYGRVGDIVESVCGLFEEQAEEKNLSITYSIDANHMHILCDKTKLQEILTNLISNSVKYTPAGGAITVSLCEISCEKEGYASYRTTVSDTGIGMSEEYLPHLFDSFSRERNTTSSKVAGSGLGMAIVKRLVDMMGGTIDVKSKLGAGTTFSVTLTHKIADEGYYVQNTSPDNNIESDFSGKHILMAEDNELNTEVAVTILENMGFIVDTAEDGVICVNKLEKEPAGTYDLILMDVQMPNMDGYQATRLIRELPDKQKADIPIIAMTANAFEEDKKLALSNGMNAHLSKPIDTAKIREILAQILG